MQINSSGFNNAQQIPQIYSCKGSDTNPPLSFSNIPQQTKSLALVMWDPDSPNGNFIHWILWNIQPDQQINEADGAPNSAVEGINDFGKLGYGGPCPGKGTHRYIFTLYALDTVLDLKEGSLESDFKRAIANHIVEISTLTGTFSA
jgi:Raf kinase inhibitor-like YbhB/YbcL family protein